MAGGSFKKSRARLADLEGATRERVLDAEALLKAGRYASAIAMAVYALEIALKVVICKKLDLRELPEPFAIHQLDQLLIVAGLSGKIERVRNPRGIKRSWDALIDVAQDVERYRYRSDPTWDRALAEKTLHELRNPPNGVILWLWKQA